MQNRQMEALAEKRACALGKWDNCKFRVSLRRNGYDPFIDFLKGVCIVLVVITHTISPNMILYSFFYLWGGPAVPIFFVLQSFHFYKNGVRETSVDFIKLWRRIIKPYLIIQLLICSMVFIRELCNNNFNPSNFIVDTLLWGGIGPGSYFPWVYTEIAVLLPLSTLIFRRLNSKSLVLFFVIISEGIELLGCLCDYPLRLYRLSLLPFVFTIYLGYMLAVKGVIINVTTLILSVISIALTTVVGWMHINLYPFVFPSLYPTHHWFCYIYEFFLFLFILERTFRHIGKRVGLCGCVMKIGKCSYEIFLFQMLYFTIFHNEVLKVATTIGGEHFSSAIGVPLSVIICVVPVILYKNLRTSEKTS